MATHKDAQLSSKLLGLVAARASLTDLAPLFSLGAEPQPPLSQREKDALRHRRFEPSFLSAIACKAQSVVSSLRGLGLKDSLAALHVLLRGKGGEKSPARARLTMGATIGVHSLAQDLSLGALLEGYGEGRHLADLLGEPVWWEQKSYALAAVTALKTMECRDKIDLCFDADFDSAVCTAAHLQSTRLKWAFAHLHDAGFAHSVEAYTLSGRQLGVGFGVAVGDYFFLDVLTLSPDVDARSFFKQLADTLQDFGVNYIVAKPSSLFAPANGFSEIERSEHASRLQNAWPKERIGKWRIAETALAA